MKLGGGGEKYYLIIFLSEYMGWEITDFVRSSKGVGIFQQPASLTTSEDRPCDPLLENPSESRVAGHSEDQLARACLSADTATMSAVS